MDALGKLAAGRMGEPSTWAGFAGVLEGLKMVFPQWAGAIMALQAIAGGVAVLVRETGGNRG